MDHPHEFRLNGRDFRLTVMQVENALRKVAPGKIHVHAVEVGGVRYPVRQALALALGVGQREVSTDAARRAFLRLGLPVSASPTGNRKREADRLGPARFQGGVRPRFPRAAGLPRPPRVETDPDEGTPAAQVQALELPPIVLAWSAWTRWDDLRQDERLRTGPRVPIGRPGVYEVIKEHHVERLAIGRTVNLRERVKHELAMGNGKHAVHDAIVKGEDTSRVLIRWAVTDRPSAAEEELHRRHLRQHGKLPKYTQRT